MRPFTFLVLSLSSFRLQRIVTTDKWPPSKWFRSKLTLGSFWDELFNCPWCFGFWVTIAVFVEHFYIGVVPLWIHLALAASTVVGFIGNYDSD